MEVGGSGPSGEELTRNSESDTRHMLAFLFDLAKSPLAQNIVIEMRWADSFGIMIQELYPRY